MKISLIVEYFEYSKLTSLSDNLKYSLNYVMYEFKGVVSYSTSYTS